MRRAARRDDNHAEIVTAFRSMGCKVFDTGAIGQGFTDLVVKIHPAYVTLVEVKDGRKCASARQLTPAQIAFRRDFPLEVIETVEQAIDLVNRVRTASAQHCVPSQQNGNTGHHRSTEGGDHRPSGPREGPTHD